MNFIEAVKARNDGKEVVHTRVAYNLCNLRLELAGHEAVLVVDGENRCIPIDCIMNNGWKIVEKKRTLYDERHSNRSADCWDYSQTVIEEAVKKLIKLNLAWADHDVVKAKLTMIFGEELMGE